MPYTQILTIYIFNDSFLEFLQFSLIFLTISIHSPNDHIHYWILFTNFIRREHLQLKALHRKHEHVPHKTNKIIYACFVIKYCDYYYCSDENYEYFGNWNKSEFLSVTIELKNENMKNMKWITGSYRLFKSKIAKKKSATLKIYEI